LAQRIAYLDFGFIEPTLLAAIAKTVKDGQAAPKRIEGALVTRVAMGVDVIARLHQQIQKLLVGLRDARQGSLRHKQESGANDKCTITRPDSERPRECSYGPSPNEAR